LFGNERAPALHGLQRFQKSCASLAGLERWSKCYSLEVSTCVERVLYQANAFQEDMRSLASNAYTAETFHERILATCYFFNEHYLIGQSLRAMTAINEVLDSSVVIGQSILQRDPEFRLQAC
jgi:hypothetical protein